MEKNSSVLTVVRSSRPARILILSNIFAVFGDTVLVLVLAIWVKDLTGSSGEAGGIFVALGVPALLSLLGGRAIDSLTPRSALVAANTVSIIALLPLFLVSRPSQIWIVYGATCLYGGGTYLFQAARAGAAARAVSAKERSAVISVLRSTRQVMTVVAPSLGALLYTQFNHNVVVAAAIGALLLSCLVSLALKVASAGEENDRESYEGFLAGITHVWNSPVLRWLTAAMMIHLSVAGFFQIGVIALLDDLDEPAGLLGPITTVQGIGAALGAVLAPSLCTRMAQPLLVAVGIAVEGAGALILAVSNLEVAFVGAFLIGAGLPLLLVGSDTALMNRTPIVLQGRASLAVEVTTSVPLTLSFASASLIVGIIGPRPLLFVMAAVTAASVYVAFLSSSAESRASAQSVEGMATPAENN
ncbi:MFS transporter [Streptomyces sp. NPDC002519]